MDGYPMDRIRARVTERIEGRVVATAADAVKYVRAVPPAEANGLVAAVYAQLTEDFQITAPLVLHSPTPRLLAAVWCVLRETLIAGRIPRAEKEAIATGVSQANAFATEPLTEADQPLAAFALLCALAPYQVDPSIVESFRAWRPADQDVIGAAGWAAFTAARRVCSWLAAARSAGRDGSVGLEDGNG